MILMCFADAAVNVANAAVKKFIAPPVQDAKKLSSTQRMHGGAALLLPSMQTRMVMADRQGQQDVSTLRLSQRRRMLNHQPLQPLVFTDSGFSTGSGSSASSSSRYRTTLPRSSSKPIRRLLWGTKQSGTTWRITQPRTPLLAASIAAYSSRRVLSLVQ